MPSYSPELMEACRRLYIRGWAMEEICKECAVPENTLFKWRKKHHWDRFIPADTLEISFARRINRLMEVENKTPAQLEEMSALIEMFAKLMLAGAKAICLKSQADALAKGVLPGTMDLTNPKIHDPKARNLKRKKPPKIKNDISGITVEQLDEVRKRIFWGYQHVWFAAKNDPATRRNRFILKARQIGATYYFAFEALDDAIRTGDNQLFLSASRDQAEVFKAYIIAFAQQEFGVELRGPSVLLLSNGAELRFLSTNSNTAQSYHGHLYIDEIFWIPHFKRMWRVASAMSAHKKWRRTMFSTPSALSHQAHPKWSGEEFNAHKHEKNKVEFDVKHDALKDGLLGADKIWRHMVTVEDAENQGCNLFDIEELRAEYSEEDFANLFMCRFIDDSQSVFSLAKMLACTVDLERWKDYDPDAPRPFGNKPVALGYDPSRTRDNASLAELAVPLQEADKWRVLANKSYHGQNFQYQSNRIEEIKNSRNCVHIGIDTTGIGRGVFELVQVFFPLATPIHYSLDMKTQLVIKALDVVDNGRFQYLAADHEITRAFMMITQTTTASGVITYASSRSTEAGHADVAWSIMHALNYEPINSKRRTSKATFSE